MKDAIEEKFHPRPFEGMKIYFSNSIKGDIGKAPDLGAELVRFMAERGGDVLSENVAFLKPEEGLPIFQRRSGIDLARVKDPRRRARVIRKVDLGWVDQSTHLVAVVNGASYGVGMELQRAIDKPRMGMKTTPILCLVHSGCVATLSSMVSGVDQENEGACFELAVYESVEDAKEKISEFLLKNKKQ